METRADTRPDDPKYPTSQNPDEKRIQALIKEISSLNEQLMLAEASMQQRLSQAGCGAMACVPCVAWAAEWA